MTMFYLGTKEHEIALTLWLIVLTGEQRVAASNAFKGSCGTAKQGIDEKFHGLVDSLFSGLSHQGRRLSPTLIVGGLRALSEMYDPTEDESATEES